MAIIVDPICSGTVRYPGMAMPAAKGTRPQVVVCLPPHRPLRTLVRKLIWWIAHHDARHSVITPF